MKKFSNDILSSNLCQNPLPQHVDQVVDRYNTVLRELLNQHAPLKTLIVAHRPTVPWVNDGILEAKRVRRRWERLDRNSGLTVYRQQHKDSCERVKDMIRKAKAEYFVNKIDECSGDQKKLFQIVDKLLGRDKKNNLPHFDDAKTMAQEFNDFFVTKIATIRTSLATLETSTDNMYCPSLDSLLTPPISKLLCFTPTTTSEITTIIKKASKATCLLDPIPTNFLHDLLPVLAPIITELVNTCLSNGVFPSELKSAIVQPLLKKPSLVPEELSNFRPVSNLSFISRVIEKVVASRLMDHMTSNNLLDPLQSAYRPGHSTETALLRVHNDLVTSIDDRKGVFLVLLDLSAAFDTVDHTILLDFLVHQIGLGGPVLNLFKSYLSGRTQCVWTEGVLSELCELAFGVPQGSVLGPLAFCIYTIPIGAIMRHYNISYHIYADDTQLYCTFDTNSPIEALDSIRTCISDIRSWMIRNQLKINDKKTEFVIITSPRAKIIEDLQLVIGQSNVKPSSSAKSLGVMFDKHMNMEVQIRNICKTTHFHLRNISLIRDLLPTPAVVQLIHSLITSRLDYCNSLLYGLPDCKIARIQRIQNIAARIVTRCPRQSHITPVLKNLHWLPVKYRVLFKILLLTYKCNNTLAPGYLSCLVTPYQQESSLRSQSQGLLQVPKSRLKSYGDRSFRFAAATEWNRLPVGIRLASSINAFKTGLKSHLFKECFNC